MSLRFFRIYTIFLIIWAFQIGPFDNSTTAGNILNDKQESENILDTVSTGKFSITPPIAEKIERTFIEHGNKRIDKYFWLRDSKDPRVIDYINAENSYTDAMMEHTIPLQEKLFSEMSSRIKQDDQTAPYFQNGFYYYSRFEDGCEYPVYCRKKGSLSADEEILLNVNELAKGHKLFKIGTLKVNPNNEILAYSIDTAGNNKYRLLFKNLTNGNLLNEIISNISGTFEWANDSKIIYYSILDSTNRSYKIKRHSIGSNIANDVLIYHEKDPEFEVYLNKTKSDRFILLECDSKTSSETRYIDLNNPSTEPQIVQRREKSHIYSVDHQGNKFYIRTNLNAVNYKLVKTAFNKPSKEYWEDVINYDSSIFLEDYEVFNKFIVLIERINGLQKFRVINLDDNSCYYIDFPESDYEISVKENKEINSVYFRFMYTSLKTPPSIYDYNLDTHDMILLKQDAVLGGYNPENYITERLYAKAKDGVNIPISVVYKKGIVKDGNNPVFLYGYGAYGTPSNSSFAVEKLSLLERGFIIAVTHVRGGEEMGRQWYEDGKLLKKLNSFNDFIACAEYLINEKYTSPSRMFASGKSAGGLLVSAVANFRPDLFKGIIAEVPWVDVIADMFDNSIPLTSLEYDEWGNPNDKTYYKYMLSYSPYDNIVSKNYPAILTTGALNDRQVMYWNPVRWVAKLRELKTDNNPILLKVDMNSGHSGQSGRFSRFKDTAFRYAFILDQLGINK